MSRHPPAPTGARPSDRLEELALQLTELAKDLAATVQQLKEEMDHEPD